VPRVIQPGDTICLRGGTYLGGYEVQLSGSASAQITVQPYPGEHAIIDGVGITVDSGGYITIRDLEVTNSDPDRTDYRAGGFAVKARGVKIINNVIHDTGAAITSNETGYDDEFYGNLMYNIGWDDRNSGLRQGGTGPAFYVSNLHGFKKFYDNIITNGFGSGFHLYSAGTGHLTNFDLQGNVSYNNGYLTRFMDSSYATEGRTTENFIIGNRPITNLVFKNNIGFHREQRGGMNLDLGFGDAQSNDAVIQGNTMIGGTNSIARFASLNFSNNVIASHWESLYYTSPATSIQQVINNNTYWIYSCEQSRFFVNGVAKDAAHWRAAGFDANSTINPCGKRDRAPTVTIRANAYDANRFHVIVNNPAGNTNVTLNLSPALLNGATFELRNAQDPFGPPVASGTYNGPISINMTTLKVAVPIGYVSLPKTTPLAQMTSGPQFGAFILTKK
jgi:hypothetical protein